MFAEIFFTRRIMKLHDRAVNANSRSLNADWRLQFLHLQGLAVERPLHRGPLFHS